LGEDAPSALPISRIAPRPTDTDVQDLLTAA
jgi:hypothetical protein